MEGEDIAELFLYREYWQSIGSGQAVLMKKNNVQLYEPGVTLLILHEETGHP